MNLNAAVTSPVNAARREAEPVAVSPAMREVLAAARDVAPTPTTVLLLGESGTGKEILARYVHRHSPRYDRPYVAVNCAALPSELLESELFGHERGAFTGAGERRSGRIELADKGTLLLDEISEMPLGLQAKLLRVLQEREIDRVGGQRPIPVDIRVIATSNRDLAAMVRQGSFRADLYYRLNVFPIRLPPLRERLEDLPGLATQLIADLADQLGIAPPRLTDAAVASLQAERFPGNVRELGNLLERALVRGRGPFLDACHLGLGGAPANNLASIVGLQQPGTPQSPQPPSGASASAVPVEALYPATMPLDLTMLERLAIEEALRRVSGNRTHAARLLGIGLRTLRNKLRQWREEGLPVPPSNEGGAGVETAA